MLATIVDGNLTDKVTRGDLLTFLSRYQIPDDDDRQELYSGAMERLINTKLLDDVPGPAADAGQPREDRRAVEQLKQDLKKDGQDLATALVQNNISLDDIRKEYEDRIRWQEYLKKNATEATLRRYRQRAPRSLQRHADPGQPHPASRSIPMRPPPRRKKPSRS